MKTLLILLVLLGVTLAAGAYWVSHSASGAFPEDAFTLGPVEWGPITETVSATGILQPHEVVAVGSELSGRVVELYPNAEPDKVVQEGDPLLKLDDRSARIKLDQAGIAVRMAQADLARAEALQSAAKLEVTRQKELGDKDIGFRRELDRSEMTLKAADAAVQAAGVKVEEARAAQRLAQLGLDLTIVRVPAVKENTGDANVPKRKYVVLEKKVMAGQLIAPPASGQLFTLASELGRMQAHTQVSENDVSRVRPGLSATFTVYAYADEDARFEGKITEVRPMPTSAHGAVFYDTVLDVANRHDPRTKEWMLRPGMTAAVDIILRRHAEAWKLPTEALNLQLDPAYQSEAAREKLAQWQSRSDRENWRPVWVLDEHRKPWPVFVRIGGENGSGETGIKDSLHNEVLDWDPDLQPAPRAGAPETYPRVIIAAKPAKKPGLFSSPPNVRVF